jgi:hypothetical protein
MENANDACALWALDMDWLIRNAERQFKYAIGHLSTEDPHLKSKEFFDLVFNRYPPFDLVYSLNPERRNERLIIQQGLFLAPANITKTFEENIAALQATDTNAGEHIQKLIIRASPKLKREILRHLFRMNVTRATLFPGLDGFAASLRNYLAFPDILKARKPFS